MNLKQKLSGKQPKVIKHLQHQIILFDVFPLFTAKACRKNDVEVTEHGGEIYINQGYLQDKLDHSNISDKTQYYSDKFKQ